MAADETGITAIYKKIKATDRLPSPIGVALELLRLVDAEETTAATIAPVVESVFEPPVDKVPGRGGVRRFTFRAKGKGTASLTLRLRRAWQPNPREECRFSIEVA